MASMKIENDTLYELGKLIAVCSSIESVVIEFIVSLLTMNKINQRLNSLLRTTKIGYRDMFDQLLVLYKSRVNNEELAAKFSELKDKLQREFSERNKYVHGEWILGDNSDPRPILSRERQVGGELHNEGSFIVPNKIRVLIREMEFSESQLRQFLYQWRTDIINPIKPYIIMETEMEG